MREPEQPTGRDASSSASQDGPVDNPDVQPASDVPPNGMFGEASTASGGPPVAAAEGPPQPVRPTRGPSEIALGGVLLTVVVGLALVGQDHWRRGLLLAGIGLIAGAALRLVLPARVVGLLAVRGRIFDAVVLAGLGAAVIVLTTSVPLPVRAG